VRAAGPNLVEVVGQGFNRFAHAILCLLLDIVNHGLYLAIPASRIALGLN
jgi:hypothetical protein